MKFYKILLMILSLVLCQIPGKVLAVSQTIDQTNLAGANFSTVLNNTSFFNGQSFKPSLNRLTRIDVDLNMAAGPNPDLNLTFTDFSNNVITTTTKNCVDGVNAFVFSAPIEVTTDQEYRFFLQDVSGNYSLRGVNPGNYSRGQAIVGGALTNRDFMFRSWGYNIVQPPESSPAVLEPPTNLTAEDVPNDEGGAVKLRWDVNSQAAIDGYNIYRSEKTSGDPDYLLVGDVKKGENEYTDEDNLDPTKTYLYVVRAFKDSFESENSNSVEISPEDNMAPNAPQNLVIGSHGKGWVVLNWQGSLEPDLDKYQIKYGRNAADLSEVKEVASDQTNVKVDHLRRGTKYYFVITALDKSGNVSPSSNRVEVFIDGLNWIWYLWIAIFIIFCVLIYLYFAFKKRLWPFKNKKIVKEVEQIIDKITPDDDIIKDNKSEANMAEAKKIGKITHFFGKIGVGIIKLDDTLSVGDKIKIKGATTDFEQEISSIQIDHKEVQEAKAGDEVGVKLDDKVREDDEVFLS